MFKEDYRELNLDGAEAVAERVFLFEEFIDGLLTREPDALNFNGTPARAALADFPGIHGPQSARRQGDS